MSAIKKVVRTLGRLDRATAKIRNRVVRAIATRVRAHMRKGKKVRAHTRVVKPSVKRAAVPIKKAAAKRPAAGRAAPRYLPNPAGASIQTQLDREWRAAHPWIGRNGEDIEYPGT